MELSGTNAWYINLNNGNQNNNNKNNANYVRAVSAFQHDAGGFVLTDIQRNELDTGFREAYFSFIAGKRNTNSVAEFIVWHQYRLVELVDSIVERKYRPEPLRVFITFYPTIREIFESVARDRIVDTWISFRVEPLMNKVLLHNAPACRAELGTKESNRMIKATFDDCVHNHPDWWIMKYDVQSYYMSIDKYRLHSMWMLLIDLYYDHWDKEILKWLLTVRLMTDPRVNAIRMSPMSHWNLLPPHKSLFNHPTWQGIPIGLLPTNESANLYLTPIDYFIVFDLGYGENYSRSIDDSWIANEKPKILHDMPLIRDKYREIDLTIHPNKYYFQHFSKGIKILNVMQLPGRTYSSNRSITKCFKKIHWWNEQARDNVAFQIENCEKFAATINSYLGMLQHLDEFNKRKEISMMVFEVWSKVMYPDRENFYKMTVRKRYKTKARINRRIKRNRRRINNYVNSIIAMAKSQPTRSFGPAQKAIAKEKINDNQWIGRAKIEDMTRTEGEGENQTTVPVEGMKQWIEMRFDHEPTVAELDELSQITFE